MIEEGGVFSTGILTTDFSNPIEGPGEVLEVGKTLRGELDRRIRRREVDRRF